MQWIQPEWLKIARNKCLFYPCAGEDYFAALDMFGGVVSEFWFCDLEYPRGMWLDLDDPRGIGRRGCGLGSGLQLLESHAIGDVHSKLERRYDADNRPYRWLSPSKLVERYRRDDGSKVEIIRRRGFGQYALTTEFEARSIGVFMHRGDMVPGGEGASGVVFLGNRRRRHEPVSRLFEKLRVRLADQALIVSDGSNTSWPWLNRFYLNRIVSCRQAYERNRDWWVEAHGFRWQCVGWMTMRYGPTLIWGVTRLPDEGQAQSSNGSNAVRFGLLSAAERHNRR